MFVAEGGVVVLLLFFVFGVCFLLLFSFNFLLGARAFSACPVCLLLFVLFWGMSRRSHLLFLFFFFLLFSSSVSVLYVTFTYIQAQQVQLTL